MRNYSRIIIIGCMILGMLFGSLTWANAKNPAYQGYTFFSPLKSNNTYLVDMDGNVVKTWTSEYKPGNAAYILEDRSMLRTISVKNSVFGSTGGAGGGVELHSWDSDLIWSYIYSSEDYCSHHDVEMLPNGNILMIAWEKKTKDQSIAAGRNPSLINEDELWPDHIIEIRPDGVSGGTIVWEWHVWDHLVQDYDVSKENFGVVENHPELIDLNFNSSQGNADWNHTNSISYNEEFDQILLSVHGFSEIWIIDHSTTTQEAAQSTGGRSGKGGDLLYRWGNPQAYQSGDSNDQKLFKQHDATWIFNEDTGSVDILVFNNGMGRPGGNYSSVNQITPPVDKNGNYSIPSGSAYGPALDTWSYDCNFFAQNISGASRLSNGNTLICSGPDGYFREITSSGDIVWEYNNPFPDNESDAPVFHCYRYSLDYLDISSGTYNIVDTAQTSFFDDQNQIVSPLSGEAYYGQDALYTSNTPSYTLSNDSLVVLDNNTQLTWVKSPDTSGDGKIDSNDKLSLENAQLYCQNLNSMNFGGYNDWRVPTIKELYSLIVFNGTDPSGLSGNDTSDLTPFIDTRYFDFGFGDTNAGERIIDAQYLSSTQYVSTTMNGSATLFGVNFADGRIKGYPLTKQSYIIYVRGNSDYGKNTYNDNGDGTISDSSTRLMWSREDNGAGLNWQEALAWVQTKNEENYLGYNDWRMPNPKELHSIVDYSRSPDTTNSPAMDSIFNCSSLINEAGSKDYPFFWTNTTHMSWNGQGKAAVYIAFGRALGYMNGSWMDVHGAGAQRSDPKSGDISDYPFGRGPQGDAIRINNYVRLVRGDLGQTSLPAFSYYVPLFKAQSYSCGLAITNLSLSNTANILVTIYDQNGSTLNTETKTLSARGQDAFQVGENLKSDGWINIGSDQSLAGFSFLVKYEEKNIDYYMAYLPFARTLSKSLIIPHVAQNPNWDTTIYFANPNNTATNVNLIYTSKSGTASNPHVISIPANGSKEVSLEIIAGSNSINGGYVNITSTNGLTAFALYNNLKTGNYSYVGINAVDISNLD